MTLRTRITAFAGAAVLVVLALAGFVVVRAQERLLLETVDESLQQQAAADLRDPDDPLVAPVGDDDAIAQLVAGARVVESTGGAPRPGPIAAAPPSGRTVVRTVAGVAPGEPPYRVLSADLGDGRVLHLAVPLDDVRDSQSALLAVLLVVGPVTAVVLAAVIWWFVGRTLRPVEAMRSEVATIGGRDLHRRLPAPATDDEVGRLGRTLNDMLDRLEAAAEQQRRFVADASHELRTPLTRMRSELEVDLAHPAGADLLATHRSALEEVDGLQRLVDDLLHLARQDAEPGGAGSDEIGLDDLVRAVAAATPVPDGTVIDTSEVRSAQVRGHAGSLSRAVANLLDNAVRHAQGRVWIGVADADGRARLIVDDDGPGIPVADRQRVFERFTRLDDARTADAGGAGLGLAIVHAVVSSHGGSVAIDARPGGGTRVTVDLPALS